MMDRLFAKHPDKNFLETLHQHMLDITLEYQKSQPMFLIVNQMEITLLDQPKSRKTVNDYLHAMQGVRTRVSEMVENNNLDPETLKSRVGMISIIDDVMGNIMDNQAKIATAKVALVQMAKEFPDFKKEFKKALDCNTTDVDLFTGKVSQLRDVKGLEGAVDRFDSIINALPKNNFNMHHLNKEQFEVDRKLGKG